MRGSFIPVSGLTGDNLVAKKAGIWYSGDCLLTRLRGDSRGSSPRESSSRGGGGVAGDALVDQLCGRRVSRGVSGTVCGGARAARVPLPAGPAGVVTGAGGVWGAQWGCRAFLKRYSRGWREDAGGVCRRELRAGARE